MIWLTKRVVTWMSLRHSGDASRWTHDVPVWTGRQYEPSGGWPVHCVNPLSWRADEIAMPADRHRGARLRLIRDGTIRGGLTGAQCQDGVLRVDDTGEPGIAFFMFQGGDFHPIEYSLFYADIAANAATRIAAWHRR